MKKTYQVRHEGKQSPAQWTEEGWIIDGAVVPFKGVQILDPYVTTAQIWEWYGDEEKVGDPAFGRYKPKGGQDFIVHLTTEEAWNEEAVLAKLNARLNESGKWIRFEFNGSLQYYWEPTVIVL
jgi:hypothetical protein